MSNHADHRIVEVQSRVAELKQAATDNAKAAAKRPTDAQLRHTLATSRRELVQAEEDFARLRATITNETFVARIQSLRQDAELLEVEIGQAALASIEAPADIELMERVESLRKQRDDVRSSIDDIELAKRAAMQRQVVITNEERKQRLTDLQTLHVSACETAIRRTVELIDYLAPLGAMWVAAHGAAREAEVLGHEAARLAGGSTAVKKLGTVMGLKLGEALAQGVGCAFIASRIATDGPDLSSWVRISQPSPSSFKDSTIGATETEEAMRKAVRRQQEIVQEFAPDSTSPSFWNDVPVSAGFYDVNGDGLNRKRA